MWSIVETATYAGLAVGFGLLLWLLGRRQEKKDRTHRLLETAAAMAVIWILGLGTVAHLLGNAWWLFVWRRVAQVGLVVLALVMAEFSRSFALRPYRWPWRTLVAVLLVSAALALDVVPAALPTLPSIPLGPTLPAGLLLLVAWLSFSLAAWVTGIQALRHATGAQHRNRIRYLLLALTCLTAGDALIWGATTGPAAWSQSGVPLMGLAARLAGLSILTFAVLRYHLPDVMRLVLRGVRFGLLSGLIMALLLASVLITSYMAGRWESGLAQARSLAPALALSSMLAVIAVPRLRSLLNRVLLGGDYDLQNALRRYSEQISLILDLGRLADVTLGWLEDSLHVRRSAFILLTRQDGNWVQLKIACARHVAQSPPILFPVDSRFLVHFEHTGRPLSQYDLDMLAWFREIAPAERDWLRGLAIDLYVPVLIASRPVALLALGPKDGRRAYAERDLEALMILGGQAGTALDNARLVDDLRHVENDLQQLGAQLNETNKQLERLNQAKSDFVAIAAHELRTPLSQIYGYSDVLTSLKGDELSDGQMMHQFIDGISRGAMRLKRVIDAMIDMSLIETGSLVLQPVVLPVPVVVKNATDSIRPIADERKLKLVVGDLSRLPYIEADSVRLEQALVSLLSNAIKYTPDGGEVRVSGHVVAQGPASTCVELLIADTGIGIDREQQELIFDKFYRGENLLLHSSGEARFKGAGPGLGLAIARGIVQAHGGQLWVESAGRDEKKCPGSTFHLRLPLKRA